MSPHPIAELRVTANDWYATNPASCYACDYSGTVADFETQTAQVISLHSRRR